MNTRHYFSRRNGTGDNRASILFAIIQAIFVIILATSMATAGTDPHKPTLKDIPYKPGGGPENTLDIYLPRDPPAEGVPTVFYIHGGGWTSGDKAAEGQVLANYLLPHGYATVSVNYRLAPGEQHPVQARDVADAFAWVATRGHEYGLDTTNIYLAGASAGGHLAALLLLNESLLRNVGVHAARHLKGAMLLSGIYDVLNFVEPGLRPTRIDRAVGPDPAQRWDASPMAYLSGERDFRPPVLITHTDQDLFGLAEQAMRLYSTLLRSRWPVELVEIPDKSHYNQFALGQYTERLDTRFVPEDFRERLRLSAPETVADLLGPAVLRFLASVRDNRFVPLFERAWPAGLPTSGFTANYTMSPPLPEVGHSKQSDVRYSAADHGAFGTLDIYKPVGENPANGPLPIMVYVHGGGFRAGDKDMVAGLMQTLVRNGVIFISVNYRLSPAVKFPAHAQDVAEALAWVVRHAAEFGGDPERLAIMGISAGGHLVSSVALDTGYLAAHGLDPNILRGVLSISGLYDMVWFKEPGVIPGRLHQAFQPGEDSLRVGSPQTYVRADAPPFVVTFTDDDLFLVREGSQRFYDAALAAGGKIELVEIPGRDHFNQQIGIGRHVGLREDTLGPVLVRFAMETGLISLD